jgi:hypothetical protein
MNPNIKLFNLFIVLFFIFISNISFAQKQKSQNPSPMVESTRKHERIKNKDYPGEKFSLDDILSKPVQIYIPESTKKYENLNLLIHFHGMAHVPIFAVNQVNDNFVTAVVNLGSGSSVYEKEFLKANQFFVLHKKIKLQIEEKTGEIVFINQTILSSFSAGYGSIRAILRNTENINLIDGIILLDGLHTDYIPDGTVLYEGGKLNTEKLQPFLDFAKLASEKKKAFLITHSEIFPGMYASTTETADFLIQTLELKRKPVLKWGPLGMQQLSEAKEGHLRILGFAGNTAPDHIDHFHGLYYFLNSLK